MPIHWSAPTLCGCPPGTAGRTRAASPPPARRVLVFWIPLSAALSFGFGQVFKWSQRRGCHAPTVVATNYLALAAALAVYHAWNGNAWASPASLMVGAAMGVSFIVSMLVMTRGLERAPVALVLTAFRLAILVPVAASVWLWGEALSWSQAIGIGLALVALALMTTSSAPRSSTAAGVVGLATVGLVFATQGIGQVCLRWVHYAGLDDMRLSVLMICAATAGSLGVGVIVVQRYRPRASDLRMGVGIGLYNLICLVVILTALSNHSGTLFFPVTGCLVVILDVAGAHFGWRESLGRGALMGAGLGALSMLLIL